MATTYDGIEVKEGLRVFTNDWVWGTVVKVCADHRPTAHSFHAAHPDHTEDGVEGCWHDVVLDTGREASYDHSRISARAPAGAPADPNA